MFYGALVLSKKGPLAKVWLAAHWDKKLTKAHVFETDVESTVDSIISPQMKLALRTSGHLLLGVVRIYSRKQKYLLHDLGEACAKIKMAFRPGIVDLPVSNGAENADAITLPEVFHDFEIFENAVANLETMEIEAQYTVNPSRVSEITMVEDPTTTSGSGNLFGGEFDGYDLKGGEFEGGMVDIEVPREGPEDITNEVSGKDISGGKDGSAISDATKDLIGKSSLIAADEMLPDAANDFGAVGNYGDGLGGDFGGGFMELPQISDIAVDDSRAKADEEVPMEVDPPVEPPQKEQLPKEQPPKEQPSVDQVDQNEVLEDTLVNRSEGRDNTSANRIEEEEEEEEGFVLEPVERTGLEKRARKKRRLVVDTDKEFTGQQIKSQFDDYKDLLQAKCFPPPTKKAMMWKEMAGCDQLYSNPTVSLGLELRDLITHNYSVAIPDKPAAEDLIELDNITDASRDADVTPVENVLPEIRDVDVTDATLPDSSKAAEPAVLEGIGPDIVEEGQPLDFDNDGLGAMDGLDALGEMDGLGGMDSLGGEQPEDTSAAMPKDVPDPLDIDEQQSTEEQQSNELSEEFEERRWTKRTQQVLRLLQKNLCRTDEVYFSSLTLNCNRKQAASRFYTCLLLAKEGMITATQPEPYADIRLQKGPKFVE